jgi:hypothetical protein
MSAAVQATLSHDWSTRDTGTSVESIRSSVGRSTTTADCSCKKGTLSDVEGKWDLIMFHHSLEHIEDQRGTLARVGQLLGPDGWCLIRVPTVDSDAWDEYRDRWVQLDAPRHLTLHSMASMERLADSAGLRVEAVVHDSTAFQFEGSELYRRGRPLSDLARSGVPRGQRRAYATRAAALNRVGRGDQAAFFLRRR